MWKSLGEKRRRDYRRDAESAERAQSDAGLWLHLLAFLHPGAEQAPPLRMLDCACGSCEHFGWTAVAINSSEELPVCHQPLDPIRAGK